MSPLLYAELLHAVLEKHGTRMPLGSPGQTVWSYADYRVKIHYRTNPSELMAWSMPGSHNVIHLQGHNLGNYDEDRSLTTHLLSLVPESGILLDVIADQD